MIDGGRCRWLNVVGRDRVALERVRARLALPPHVVALTLSEFLHPTVIRMPPACFVATYFTIPSPRRLFRRHPMFLWLTPDAVVTISPWARVRRMRGVPRVRITERDELVGRILDAAVASHEDVGWHLNDGFFGQAPSEDHVDWHRKERRLSRFGEILEHQLEVVYALGVGRIHREQVHEQLSGLREIARDAERKLRASGYCRICGRDRTVAQRTAIRT